MHNTGLSKAALGRLPSYLRYLKSISADAPENISAPEIARALNYGDVQVRKDLNAVSGAGRPRVGYGYEALVARLEDVLGYNRRRRAVLVGAGKLGRALLDFEGFEEYGMEIAAAFDCACARREQSEAGKPIFPMEHFREFCAQADIDIGIITVPQRAAQEVCDCMLECGINAIWSFAPGRLSVPAGVLLQQENLALSLANLRRLTGAGALGSREDKRRET